MSFLAAPADTLVTVVHELRQPLSNIETIAYYLSMVVPKDDAKIQSHLARIRELVQESNEILSSRVREAGHPAKAGVIGDGMLP